MVLNTPRFPRLALVPVVVLLCALAGGCGDDAATTPSKPPPDTGRTPPATASPLTRSGAPPAGVRKQISFPGIGDGSCEQTPTPQVTYVRKSYGEQPTGVRLPREGQAPAAYVPGSEDHPKVGEQFLICLSGFAPSPARVTITAPGGQNVTKLAFRPTNYPSEIPQLWRSPLPDESLGVYRVVARQGATVARSSYTLEPADGPGLRLMETEYIRPGEPIHVILSGFTPGSEVPINVYYTPGPYPVSFDYRTHIRATVGESGGVVLTVPTSRSDPRGCFAFLPGVPGRVLDSSVCNRKPPNQ